MPNFFSPNGDGINDLFRPIRAKGINEPDLKIFDRWGSPCYSSSELNGWNGMTYQKKMPAGMYYWHIQFATPLGELISQKGSVLLAR